MNPLGTRVSRNSRRLLFGLEGIDRAGTLALRGEGFADRRIALLHCEEEGEAQIWEGSDGIQIYPSGHNRLVGGGEVRRRRSALPRSPSGATFNGATTCGAV